MPTLDELKQRIDDESSANPEKFFAVEKIKEYDFVRGQCSNCGKHFWAQDADRTVCGEPECSGGYDFINDPPTEKTFDFVSAWTEFASFMEERGYTPIDRYPVAARWRDDTAFVRASIYDFQPYVVSGEVKPPANPLVVPQFCVRFNDIDNVGITGRHYTGFIMTGQHAFQDPDSYDQDKYFEDMLQWITEGMAIPIEKVILHEDSWGGGGNLGACMEFFVDGLELFNQVYMFFKVDPEAEKGYSQLDTKVLDMGMGHERIVWITHGSETSYEANMPTVVKKLYRATGYEPDKDVWRKFLPYSGLLNNDEVDDIDAMWQRIADTIDVGKNRLKDEVLPASALYAIADHTRTLLVALVDGVLPSNSGEQHSLRVIARRALDFIDRYDWDIDLRDVLEWHAQEMKGLYPELHDNLEQAQLLIDHEQEKYRETRKKAENKIRSLKGTYIDEMKLIELYDSNGISPELLQRMGIDVDVPSDFYAKVSARHNQETQAHQTGTETQFDLADLDRTEPLYYQNEKLQEFDATVQAVIEQDGDTYIVLDSTAFYPTGGGQMHDTGVIDDTQVVEVIKQGGVILHRMENSPSFSEGDTVHGEIDWERRKQLMQHHTATHLINGASKNVLEGSHVSQAGAKKATEKARLDITYHRKITREERNRIEEQATKWIDESLPVEKEVVSKDEAEQRYGFQIYQGGVPPGGELRIVKVGENQDIEACGGTHVENTSEIEDLVITGTKKVQDGVIRFTYKAGNAAKEYREERDRLREELRNWIDIEGYALEELAGIFQVPIEELSGVVPRFVDEWEEQKKEVWALQGRLEQHFEKEYNERPADPETLFKQWKRQQKQIEGLEEQIEDEIKQKLVETDAAYAEEQLDIDDVGVLIRIAKHVTRKSPEMAVLVKGRNAVVAARGEDSEKDVRTEIEKHAEVVQGGDDFVKGFKLKK